MKKEASKNSQIGLNLKFIINLKNNLEIENPHNTKLILNPFRSLTAFV